MRSVASIIVGVALMACSPSLDESSAVAPETGVADSGDAAVASATLDAASWCATYASRQCDLAGRCCADNWNAMTAASCRTRIETQCNANRPAAGAFDERVARACLDEMSEALTACTIPPRWSPLAAYQFRCEAVFGTKRVDDECTSIAECKQDPTGLPITCMQYALDAPKRCTPLAAGVDSYQRCAMVDGVFVQCLRGAPCVVDPMTTIGFCDPPGSSLCGGKCPGDTVCIDSTCGMRLEDGARCGNEFQCLSGVCTNYRCGWQKFPEKCW